MVIAKAWAAERLAGPLDPLLESARSNFALGEYETASFAVMQASRTRCGVYLPC
jgi:hypothetical protein